MISKNELKDQAGGTTKMNKKNTAIPSPTTVILSPSDEIHDNGAESCQKSSITLNEDDYFQLTPSSYYLNLESFVKLLPDTIRNVQRYHESGSIYDPIATLFRRLVISKQDIQPFCFIDSHKNYTRNLIATDDETFTLLLLCWNPGKYSPIHDHPCNGCWMRVCEGYLNEVRYVARNTIGGGQGENLNDDDEMPQKECQPFECIMDSIF